MYNDQLIDFLVPVNILVWFFFSVSDRCFRNEAIDESSKNLYTLIQDKRM